MYAGHAAVALALKSRAPQVPLPLLVFVCFGPDWVELAVGLVLGRPSGEVYSHMLPGLCIGALAALAAYIVILHRSQARYVFVGWLLHWPADFLTARKPLINPNVLVGLDLYQLPVVDFALESALVVGCCLLYARAYAKHAAQRRWVVLMGVALIGLQGMLDYGIYHQVGRVWRPSFSDARWRPRPAEGPVGCLANGALHGSCTHRSHLHSERAMAKDGVRGVVTLVCLTCGKEKFFTQEVPAAVSCEQCGSTVFRTFATPTEPDEAAIDALEAQARSISYGDSSPDTTADDVRDLDAR